MKILQGLCLSYARGETGKRMRRVLERPPDFLRFASCNYVIDTQTLNNVYFRYAFMII